MKKETYLVPAGTVIKEEIVKKSRFIVTISRAKTVKEAKAFIKSIGDAHPHANHNCFAFCAGPPGDTNVAGMSDDGEPSGTAGNPMLTVLLNSGVGEIAAVVTRYFGGIKLGTGGLVRAYASMVKKGVDDLETTEVFTGAPMTIYVSYADIESVKRAAKAYRVKIKKEIFEADVRLECLVQKGKENDFKTSVINMTRGEARFYENADAG